MQLKNLLGKKMEGGVLVKFVRDIRFSSDENSIVRKIRDLYPKDELFSEVRLAEVGCFLLDADAQYYLLDEFLRVENI
jgi:hypothetical protein